MYCPDQKLLFVHIPRTGGSTIEVLLEPYASQQVKITKRSVQQYDWNDDIDLNVEQVGQPYSKHWTLTEHLNCWSLDIKDVTSFTVVRNPYERLVKLFLFKLQNGEFKPLPKQPGYHESIVNKRGKHITQAVTKNWDHDMFTDFLQASRDIEKMGKRTYASMFDHCLYDGKVRIDHVLKYENFESDLKKFFIAMDLNLPNNIPVTNSTLPMPESMLKSFYNGYNREIVETVYDRDFEVFGYERWT